jgi:hypothetical protein
MTIQTIADITPNGAAVPLSTNPDLFATWITLTATGSSIRYGDVNVGAARGALLQTGVPYTIPAPGTHDQARLYLKSVLVYGAGGSDKVSITYGN